MAKSFDIAEKVGLSKKSYSEAVEDVVKDFNKEKKVSWFEVTGFRGRVDEKGDVEFQATVKIGYKS
jgi:flavin-binding protein dodecin